MTLRTCTPCCMSMYTRCSLSMLIAARAPSDSSCICTFAVAVAGSHVRTYTLGCVGCDVVYVTVSGTGALRICGTLIRCTHSSLRFCSAVCKQMWRYCMANAACEGALTSMMSPRVSAFSHSDQNGSAVDCSGFAYRRPRTHVRWGKLHWYRGRLFAVVPVKVPMNSRSMRCPIT